MPLSDIYSRHDVADRFIDQIRNGDPTLGWGGDPRLVLAYNNGLNQRWELLRHEPVRNHPNRHVMVLAGPPGAEINQAAINLLIRRLVEADTHRAGNSHVDQMNEIIKHNERLEKQRVEEGAAATADALAKFYYEAGKALGATKTEFYT